MIESRIPNINDHSDDYNDNDDELKQSLTIHYQDEELTTKHYHQRQQKNRFHLDT